MVSATAKDALYVLGGLAVIVFFIVRQRRSGRFRERSILFPIALGIYGVVLLTNTSKHLSLNVASSVLLILSGLASIGFGVIRGRTIELFVRGGELWELASWTTIGAGWGGLLLTRFALIGVAAAIGAKLAASPTSIPLMLAITLGTQMLVERTAPERLAYPSRSRDTVGRVSAVRPSGGPMAYAPMPASPASATNGLNRNRNRRNHHAARSAADCRR